MRKSLLFIAAAAMMVACSKDEIVETVAKTPILFGTSFVDNSTRAIDPSYTKDNLSVFRVYGTVQGLFGDGDTDDGTVVNIFNGDEVYKPNDWTSGAWSCDEIQYWIGDSKYEFAAIADDNSTTDTDPTTAATVETDDDGMPVSITYNADTQKDLLYATASQTTTTELPTSPVEFTFDHLLAKAYFTVNNTITEVTDKYAYKVTDLRITKGQKTGVYTIAEETWADETEAVNYDEDNDATNILDFGNAVEAAETTEDAAATFITERGTDTTTPATSSAKSNYERLLIPATYTTEGADAESLVIEYTVDLYMHNGSDVTDGSQYTMIKSTPMEHKIAYTFEKGHVYNFIINLGAPGSKIEFAISSTGVNGWDDDYNDDEEGDNNITIIE